MKGGAHQLLSHCGVSPYRELKLGQSLNKLHTSNDNYITYGLRLQHLNSLMSNRQGGSLKEEACRTDLEAFLGPDFLHGLE